MLNIIKGLFKRRKPEIIIKSEFNEDFVGNPNVPDFYNKLNKSNFSNKKIKEIDFIWCLIGNIIEEHKLGQDKEIKSGTKQFSPGAKVYCFPPLWGDGYEKIKVFGQPRKTSKFISVIIKSEHVNNWRKEKVYHPYIKKMMIMSNGWNDTQASINRLDELYNSLIDD